MCARRSGRGAERHERLRRPQVERATDSGQGCPTTLPAMTLAVPPDVLALLSRQGGVARRRDLRAAGLRRRALEQALRSGTLRALGGDVVSARLDQPKDEAARAAAVGLDGVASHTTAARLWGIDLVDDTAPCHHVTVGRDRSRAVWPGTVVHRSDLDADDVGVRDGVRVTSVLRTVLDLCRTLPLAEAVAAADSALRQGLLHLDDLVQAGRHVPPARGSSQVRRVVRLVDPASGSVLESLCRVLLVLAGLGPPETQLCVRGRGGRLLGRVDFAWPAARLVVETDGYAFHADRTSYRADRRRTNALVLDGWRVLRFSWEDVRSQPEQVVAAVRAALATC